MIPKGAPKSGCHVCSNSKVWSPNRHSAKIEEFLGRTSQSFWVFEKGHKSVVKLVRV